MFVVVIQTANLDWVTPKLGHHSLGSVL